jgi:hypothetical protein
MPPHQDIVVYHGSTSLFDVIDVTKGKPYKDFGRGFYVTKSKKHASNLALRNKRIEKERFGRNCEAYLYTFEMNQTKLSGFRIMEFLHANFEWLQFVISNRRSRDRSHSYDVVIGPTANDDTMVVINAYLDALYGEIGGEEALNILLKNIMADKLPGQIYFSNDEAAGTLVLKGQVERL